MKCALQGFLEVHQLLHFTRKREGRNPREGTPSWAGTELLGGVGLLGVTGNCMKQGTMAKELCPKLLGVDQADPAWLEELRETRIQALSNVRSHGEVREAGKPMATASTCWNPRSVSVVTSPTCFELPALSLPPDSSF